MTKSLMISIRPEHAFNILNGKKTLELRKTVPKDFKGWVYIYCTKSKPYYEPRINGITNQKMWNIHNDFIYHTDINGKVVARFWFDEYDTYSIEKPVKNIMALILNKQDNSLGMGRFTYENLINKSCVDINDIWNYAKPSKDNPDKQMWVCAWHIKKLEIFDTPLSLSDFYKANLYASGQVIKEYEKQTDDFSYRLQRPPQSWQYVYTKELENDKK